MAAITIDMADHQLQTLRELANAHGIAPEVLLHSSIHDWLNSKREFTRAANYVLHKNAALYQRLT